ncbi:ABC transporter ATP-binding protein [Pseudalkalibacillus decolorationis]|uniref:ABC transporter ATP-binding protein n=1 Tax=Pseudalkalibacillus decolorationis TaxID=163879 RepID=UPI0021491B6C|nr:ABC transporter ATP-binding protein [Pseudalkalibacillus decolorationis]
MGSVTVKNLIKQYDGVMALNNVNLEIQEGEFFALLGPSGCGKTTTMRCIAGFEKPTNGEIFIGKQKVNDIPANKRNCGMVFQSYALFPHLDVFQNVAYSLNIKELEKRGPGTKIKTYARMINKKLAKSPPEIEKKVMEILEYVELAPYRNRLTSELSGGQQQRVALARALAMEPAVLLMDEPLSNLDKKLRNSMRATIRKIQLDLGITTIFVTHDQEEAMSMADRVAVMKDGDVIQLGTPTELYSNPKSAFIADFVGSSNIFKGSVIGQDGERSIVQLDGFQIRSTSIPKNKEVEVVIRPENIEIALGEEHPGDDILEGKVLMSTYLGSIVRYDVEIGPYIVMVDTTYQSGKSVYPPGANVKLTVDPEKVFLL